MFLFLMSSKCYRISFEPRVHVKLKVLEDVTISPSAIISQPKQLNVFYILILFMIAPLPQSATFLTTSFWNFSQVCSNFLCLHSVRSTKMVEKTELLEDCLSMLYQRFIQTGTALFVKFYLYSLGMKILIWGQCMEFKMKICYTYFRFIIVRFLEMVFAMQKCEQD